MERNSAFLKLPSRGDSLAQQAYKTMRNAIISGEILPNTTLSENELAKTLSISRAPLREAIAKLRDEYMLEPAGPRGFTVPPITAGFIKDLYMLRSALEVSAAEHATWPDDSTLEDLWRQHHASVSALEEGDSTVFLENDSDLHDSYLSRCDNVLMTKQMEWIMGSVQRVQIFSNTFPSHIRQSAEEHNEILLAMESRDRPKLVSGVKAHIDQVAARLMQLVSHHQDLEVLHD